MEMPSNMEAQVRPRSGLAIKHGITVLNAPGTIDADYRGEVKVLLINFSDKDFLIEKETRIAQMIFSTVSPTTLEEVDTLDETLRGSSGFGSTGNEKL
jgi:dUTP pyrophosphatase